MLSQTAVFTRRVADHMDRVAVVVPPQLGCAEVVSRLRESGVSAAIVGDAEGWPVGILTEQDIARRVAFAVAPQTPVREVMSTPVHTIDAGDYLYNGVARMRRDDIRHMPVLEDGRVVGLLELDRVLARLSGQTVSHIDLLDHERTPDGMRAAKQNQYRIAAQLLADEVPAADIQQLLTRLDHQLHRGAVEHCLCQLERDGRGRPPVAFEVLVMGSGGRGESYLHPDQDNGLILADYPDESHNAVDAWFIDFSECLTRTLHEIGFPYCHGHVMATNPLWRKTFSQWHAQVGRWIGKSEGQVLRLSDIFFDFVGVYGDGGMTSALRDYVTRNARRPFFLREMFKVDQEHGVALGPFGWLLPDRQKGPNRGKLNLKLTGTLPLVEGIRILALKHGEAETSTLARIAALHELGVLSRNEQDSLEHAYRHIAYLLLRQQLEDVAAGLEPGNHVATQALSKREKDQLVAGFKAIRAFRSRLRTELTGDLF